jgi:hypothetical protein
MLSAEKEMPHILADTSPDQRRHKGDPVGVEESAKGAARKPRGRTDKPEGIVFRPLWHLLNLSLRLVTAQLPLADPMNDLLKVLAAPKVDPMLTDLPHLSERFMPPVEHNDDRGMLAEGFR